MLLRYFGACLAAALVLSPGKATGQTVQGQLLDRDTQAPVEGALMLLLDAGGEERDGYLTNSAGRFILRAPGPGTYTVRAERIGFETVTSDPFSLEASQMFGIRLETAQAAIELEGLEVTGEQQCVVRPDEGLIVAQVWEEARKALAVQEWTELEGLYRFQVINYERELDPYAHRVEAETRRVSTGVSRNPITSLPAEDLMENGFVRQHDDGSVDYFGPDAGVLLSDVFLDTHCFRLAEKRDQPSALGLAFEPVRAGERADISGTLWLDRETAQLQVLEYGYTWAPWAEAWGVARGRVEFEQLPNGSWIVRKWWIRMPEVVQDLALAREGRTGIRVDGIREAGGEVARVSTLARETISETVRGTLAGTVWDSTAYGPLVGARVYLSGTQYSALTDQNGEFFMDGLPEGVFTAAFSHPRLDTLGIRAPGQEVEIRPGEAALAVLGVPSTGSIMAASCPEHERGQLRAAIVGLVRDANTGAPLPQATVVLEWSRFQFPGGVTVLANLTGMETVTSASGQYVACGVPADHLIIAQASFLNQRSDTVHVRVLEDAYAVLDLEIEIRPGLLSSRTTVRTLEESEGIQGVRGILREPASGRRVQSADLTLSGSGGQWVVRGTSNERGFFRLRTPKPGPYSLSAQALRYAPAELESVEEERSPKRLTDLFVSNPGTRVVEGSAGGTGVYFRARERFGFGGVAGGWPIVDT